MTVRVSWAQSDTLSLRAGENVVLESAVIQVFAKAQSVPTAFLITDAAGLACCVSADQVDSLIVSHLGTGVVAVYPQEWRQAKGHIYITLATGTLQLPSAEVRAKRFNGLIVNGDTLIFKADYFADGRERTLRELLNQMPGLSVSRQGVVTYAGKPVDRILIDGQDVIRSQFEIANILMLPLDLLNAQVILELDDRGREIITLNLDSKSKADQRASASAALTARGQPSFKATYLRIRPERWQYFIRGSTEANAVDRAGSVDLREEDFEIDRLRQEVIGTSGEAFSNNYQRDQSFVARSAHSAQFNASRRHGPRNSRVYLNMQQSDQRAQSIERVSAASNGQLLGELSVTSGLGMQRFLASAAHTDSIGRSFGYTVAGWLELRGADLQEAGVTSLGAPAGEFRFTDDKDSWHKRALLNARWRMMGKSSMQAFTEYTHSTTTDRYLVADALPVYGQRSQQQDGLMRRDFNQDRRIGTLTTDVRLRLPERRWNWLPFMQANYRHWGESLADEPRSEVSTKRDLRQRESSLLAGTALNVECARFRLDASFAAQRIESIGTRLQGSQRALGPHISLLAHIELPKNWKLMPSGSAKISGYLPEEYWATVTPMSSRKLELGLGDVPRIGFHQHLSLGLRRIDQANGGLAYLNLSASRSEYGIQPRLRVQDHNLVLEPVIATHLSNLSAFAIFMQRVGMHGLSVDASFQQVGYQLEETLVEQLRAWSNINVSTEWTKLLHTKLGGGFSTLAQEGSGKRDATALTVFMPTVTVELRGERLTLSTTTGARIAAQTNLVVRLDAQLMYAPKDSRFQWYLNGEDLLNYRRSTFRDLIVTTAELREINYSRLPGYVEFGGRWVFGS